MENAALQKRQAGGTPSVAHALWDPFWLMREMFGWGRTVDEPSSAAKAPVGEPSFAAKETHDAPSSDVTETDGAYVCKFKLTLPDQADVARAKAELHDGELTLVVPKAAAAKPEPISPPPRTRRTQKNGRGSAAHTPRRGASSRSRRS